MPSYYCSINEIFIDTHNEAETTSAESMFGSAPAAKHAEAHDIYTREHLETMGDISGGDEALIYDEIVSRGGYLYADVSYDYDDYFTKITYTSYFPTKEIFEEYHEWLMTKTIFARHAKETDDPKAAYLDPANSPGRGYTNVTRSYVDFNKPYRS